MPTAQIPASAGARLRNALAQERPLQVVGTVNAYSALTLTLTRQITRISSSIWLPFRTANSARVSPLLSPVMMCKL